MNRCYHANVATGGQTRSRSWAVGEAHHRYHTHTDRPLRRGPGAAFLFLGEYRIPPPGLPGGESEASRASALFNVQHVFNNPVKYQDPSGHIACDKLGTEVCDENNPTTYTNEDFGGAGNAYAALKYVAEVMLKLFGGKDDLEALARIVEAADKMYDKSDTEGFLNGINQVLTGSELPGVASAAYATNGLGNICASVGPDPSNGCKSRNRNSPGAFRDEGFHPDFQDGHNQLFHFWSAFVGPASSPLSGNVITTAGNLFHEIVDLNSQRSWQDYALTDAGRVLGTAFNLGYIKRDELGGAFRTYLGPNGPGSMGFVGAATWLFGPLEYQQ